ncbi:MAG: hypothetical protein BJ554DRAFT_7101, partial [Olpidium bornovanus]
DSAFQQARRPRKTQTDSGRSRYQRGVPVLVEEQIADQKVPKRIAEHCRTTSFLEFWENTERSQFRQSWGFKKLRAGKEVYMDGHERGDVVGYREAVLSSFPLPNARRLACIACWTGGQV